MPRRVSLSGHHQTLSEIAKQHDDVEAALILYFSPQNPDYQSVFFGLTQIEVKDALVARREEAELSSIFSLLSAIEAAFRVDYVTRCELKYKDVLSRYFRDIYSRKGVNASLDEDIFEGWKKSSFKVGKTIGDVRGAFNFRHWLAHGRYWTPKLGRTYDYLAVSTITAQVFNSFPFVEP